MRKRRIPINPPRLKSKYKRDNIFTDKLLAFQISGKDISFRKEFSIPLDGFSLEFREKENGKKEALGYVRRDNWLFELQQDEDKYGRYKRKIKELADEFGFKDWEWPSLEEYLQTGHKALVLGFSSADLEQEKKDIKPTRQFETPFFVRHKISKMRKQGKRYNEIAEYYNQKLKDWGIPNQKVTDEWLRQIFSRTQKRLKLHILKRSKADEAMLESLKEEFS